MHVSQSQKLDGYQYVHTCLVVNVGWELHGIPQVEVDKVVLDKVEVDKVVVDTVEADNVVADTVEADKPLLLAG